MRRTLLSGLLALPLGYGAASVLLGDWLSSPGRPLANGATVPVYACSNGVHVDLVLPVRDAGGTGPDLSRWFPPSHFRADVRALGWLGFGWGSRRFYLETRDWSDLRPGIALSAALGLDRSLMHVGYRSDPAGQRDCRAVPLSPADYRALQQRILARFAAPLTPLAGMAYGDHDAFYPANGRYSLLQTCNVWSGSLLRDAGGKMGWWTPFAGNVLGHLR